MFWVILWMLFVSFMMPVRRSNWASYRDLQTPLQLLQRRYAAGEITSEEYEERRVKLLRDVKTV
jgi:putative membrane protein